jgi:hypothetical protein
MNKAKLESLLTALRAAPGPSRELDAEIMFELFARPVGKKDDGGPSGYLWPEDNPSWSFGLRFPGKDRYWFFQKRKGEDQETLLIWRDNAWVLMNSLRIPKLTSSLDAAAAFRKRMLPGWDYASYYTDGRHGADVGPSGTFTTYTEYCATECLSIVAAVVAGVIAKEKTDE